MNEKRATHREIEPGISREIVAPVVEALLALGFDARAELPGLIALVDETTDSIVPGTAADRLLDVASTALRDDAIGLELAGHLPIGALGLLDYALCTSATLRDALVRVSLHYGIATDRVTLKLVEASPHAALVFQRSEHVAHSRHWLEFSLAVLATRIRQTLTRETKLGEVAFAHEAPNSTAAHDSFFATKVTFGAPDDRFTFPSSLLDAPLRTASTALAELLDAKIRALEPRRTEDPLLDRVRLEVLALLAERDVQLDSVATRLRLTRRTLQRELGRRGTSHKEILDELRRERALVLLGEALTVTEVAERLAYSEPSAFFRAFRRWTGTSPRARR